LKSLAENTALDYPQKRPLAFARDPSILVVDSDQFALKKSRASFVRAGYRSVTALDSIKKATRHCGVASSNLIFIDIDPDVDLEETLSFLKSVREEPGSIVAVTSEQTTLEICYRVAMLGADDFLLKGPHLDYVEAAKRLLAMERPPTRSLWFPDVVSSVGLFTSAGLSKSEMAVLREFAQGFPRQRAIAERLNRSSANIRKTFSRIYEKLSVFLQVDNSAQLSHVLTVCALFHPAGGH
jgi:DNA-binding NarL/FixJ family response regulator